VAEKYYCYIDETWRMTGRRTLIVGAVVVGSDHNLVRALCEEVEQSSGKGRAKWIKAGYDRKILYVRSILSSQRFHGKLFFQYYPGDCNYVEAVTNTLETILFQFDGKFTVLIDGLSRTQEREIAIRIRRTGLHSVRKIRGARDESEAFIRLADALCGLVGMAHDGNNESASLIDQIKERGLLIEL
jgi:hypothetical protein